MARSIYKENGEIASMFNNIATSYDNLNHLLSFGIDKYWRRVLVKSVMQKSPQKALDVACGTGDLTLALLKKGVDVIGLDIAQKMLQLAEIKTDKLLSKNRFKILSRPAFICSSADSIPFKEASFDAVTIGFGIRNFEKWEESLSEIYRILKKGGTLAILEFATPKNRNWNSLFNLYFFKILPMVGGLISSDKTAYKYLPHSVEEFPQYEEFTIKLEQSGFSNIQVKPLTGGVAILYTATKHSL